MTTKAPPTGGAFIFFANRETTIKKLFIGNLPADATESAVRELFSPYGTVRSVDLAHDIFTGTCKGFAFVEMEGHEARAAQAALDGKMSPGGQQSLKVRFEQPRRGRGGGRR